jgi:hypothetical protein
MEERFNCGDDGYPIGFGQRYCNMFGTNRALFSAAGQAWIDKVRTCLQVSLNAGVGASTTCNQLNRIALATHTPCYVSSGVCTICSDWLSLIHTVKSSLYSSRGLAVIDQMLQTMWACRVQGPLCIGMKMLRLTINAGLDVVEGMSGSMEAAINAMPIFSALNASIHLLVRNSTAAKHRGLSFVPFSAAFYLQDGPMSTVVDALISVPATVATEQQMSPDDLATKLAGETVTMLDTRAINNFPTVAYPATVTECNGPCEQATSSSSGSGMSGGAVSLH